METRLLATLRQQQTLSQDQQQSLRLLQMPVMELQGEIELMLEDNPLLEREEADEAEPQQPADTAESLRSASDESDGEGVGDAGSEVAEKPIDEPYELWQGSSGEDSPFDHIASDTSFREELLADLGCLMIDERYRAAVTCLIEELNDKGFLDTPLADIAAQYAGILSDSGLTLAADEWQHALEILQRMDPPGVGASGPVDSLLIQIQRQTEERAISPAAAALLRTLVSHDLLQVARNDRTALLKLAKGDEALLDRALDVLRHLSPYPITTADTGTQYVVPDILIREQNGRCTAVLNPACHRGVRLRHPSLSLREAAPAERASLQGMLSEAKAFIQGLEARRRTLQRVADEVVAMQQAYFLEGPSALRPMTLSMIADRLDLSESTVSRAAAGKFILCKHGTIEMRTLFSSAVYRTQSADEGTEEQSAAQIQNLIRELISAENAARPLTDDALSQALKAKGLSVARRTVAKYREIIGIPSARMRKRC